MKKIILCVVWVLCVTGEFAQSASSPDAEREYISLTGKISDFRLFHSSQSEIEARVKAKECLVDVRGRVKTKTGVPIASKNISTHLRPKLESVVNSLEIEIGDLGGVQLRVFKRDQITQTTRFYKNRSNDELIRLKSLIIEEGDIILFSMEE